jgi:predicted RNA-binding Zn-ribbon protein involved in translation (DUF1610 family)
MEYAILASETDPLNSLVDTFIRKVIPELDRNGFSLSFDHSLADEKARLFMFGRGTSYSSATILFESKGDGLCYVTIVVGGAARSRGNTDHELKVLSQIMNPILSVEKSLNTIYDGTSVHDENETVRQKAVQSLEQVGGETSVDTIIGILLHDGSEAVLERAALTLGHLRSDKAVDPLIEIAKKNNRLMTACAKALMDIRSQKALDGLMELLAYCDQKELLAERKLIGEAIGGVKFDESHKELRCSVCDQLLEAGDQVVQCPWCRDLAHRIHMLEWLHVHSECPSCGHDLTESELLQQPMQGRQ